MEKKMTSGEMAKKAGVSQKAIRLYDEKGLLKPTEYSEGNYRLYDDAALQILEKIVALKQIGFSLEEIRDNLKSGEASNIKGALEIQLQKMEKKKYQLEKITDAIKRTLARKEELDWDDVTEIVQYVSADQSAVDAERDLFLCESCGNWKVSVNLSLYAPNDIEFIKNQKYGEMTDEGEKVPYVMKSELEQDYHLIKEYTHICSKYGGAMRKISDNIPSTLPCPKCCTDNEVVDLMMWE